MLEFILQKYESILDGLGKEFEQDPSPSKRRMGHRRVFEEKVRETIAKEKKKVNIVLRLAALVLVLVYVRNVWLIVAAVIIYTIMFYRDTYLKNSSEFNEHNFHRYKKACEDFHVFLIGEFAISEKGKMEALIGMCEEKIANLNFIPDRNIGTAFVSVSILGSFIGYVADSRLILTDLGTFSAMGVIYMLLIIISFLFGLGYLKHMISKQENIHRYRELLEVLHYLHKVA